VRRPSPTDQTDLVPSSPSDLDSVFATVVDEEWGRLVAYVTAIVGRGDAEDVARDAVLRGYQALGGFEGTGPLEAWLFRVARSAAIDHVRRSSRRPRIDGDQFDLREVRAEGGMTGESDLHLLISALGADVREAFVLTQVVGCSYDDAARVLDVPIGTIRSRVHRARRELMAALVADEVPPRATRSRTA